MKLLTFQAATFGWEPFQRTLDDAGDAEAGEMRDCVVVFVHAEKQDEAPDERRTSVLKKTLKHVKWLANKRGLKNVVLHSFTHLGGDTADARFAAEFFEALRDRLERTGYAVARTPFGWFCSWRIDVFGESLAKVWKEI